MRKKNEMFKSGKEIGLQKTENEECTLPSRR